MDTRGRNRWHTTEPWHNSPLPEGVSHAVTVPPGRGGGRSGGPSGQTRKGTQDGDLQSGTDNGGHGGAGSSGGHGGAGSSEGHGGAGSSGGHGGAGSSGGHGGAGSSGGHGGWTSGPWPQSPRPGPYSRNSYPPPPPQISLGKWGGIRSPPGQTDRTGQPTGTGSPPGLARRLRLLLAWPGVRGPHRVPQRPPPLQRQGGRRLGMASMATTRRAACPRRVSMDQTRQGKFKMFLWAQQDNTALLAVTCGLDPRG